MRRREGEDPEEYREGARPRDLSGIGAAVILVLGGFLTVGWTALVLWLLLYLLGFM